MMSRPEAECGLRASCARLPDEKRALLAQLGRMDVSDRAFIAALAIVQLVRFDKDSLLRTSIISELTGLAPESVGRAVEELVMVGVLIRWTPEHGRRRANLYRLAVLAGADSREAEPCTVADKWADAEGRAAGAVSGRQAVSGIE
jgi:hypothetical protein